MANFKFTLYLETNQWGCTENYYWQGGAFALGTAEADLRALVDVRRRYMAVNWAIAGARISDFPGRSGSRLYTSSAYRGPGMYGAYDTKPWIAIQARLWTQDKRYRSNMYLRGFSDTKQDMGETQYDLKGWTPELRAPGTPVFPSRLQKFLLDWSQVMGVNPLARLSGFITGNYALAARATAGGDPLERVKVWRLQTDPDDCDRYQVVLSNVQLGALVGDLIHVHIPPGCNTKGVSGDRIVTKIVPFTPEPGFPSGLHVLSLNKEQCCEGEVSYKGVGNVYRVQTNPLKTYWVAIQKVVKKNLGRPGQLTRGANKKRGCCR